jgi:hypothetical protein
LLRTILLTKLDEAFCYRFIKLWYEISGGLKAKGEIANQMDFEMYKDNVYSRMIDER